MQNIFLYLELALRIGTTVQSLIVLFKSKPISGAQIAAVIQPAVMAIEAVFPQVALTTQTVLDCCTAVADVINQVK